MRVMWFSEETGELYGEEPEGIETTRIEIPPEFTLGGWLRCLNALQNEQETVKHFAAKRIRSLGRKIKGVIFWGQAQAEEACAQEMRRRRARTKSIVTLDGRVGWRKKRAIEIDEEQALPWVEVHHPGAIRIKKSIIKSELPKGEEIPGVRWPEGDVFFWRFAKRKAESESEEEREG